MNTQPYLGQAYILCTISSESSGWLWGGGGFLTVGISFFFLADTENNFQQSQLTPLPDDLLNQPKLKVFADDKSNMTKLGILVLNGKRTLQENFIKMLFPRVVNILNCVVN